MPVNEYVDWLHRENLKWIEHWTESKIFIEIDKWSIYIVIQPTIPKVAFTNSIYVSYNFSKIN